MNEIYFDKQRVISFTDAVFSIAMTLLVLEISIPGLSAIQENGTVGVLKELIPNFIGLIVSFFVIALYWIAHMRIMHYVDKIDTKVLWINLILLFFIILLPFSTALYVRGSGMTGPFVFYCINITMLGILIYLLIRKVFSKIKQNDPKLKILSEWEELKALNAIFIWFSAAVLSFFLPALAKIIFVLIFVFEGIINRIYKKKLIKLESSSEEE